MDEEVFQKVDVRNKKLRSSFLSENKIQYFKDQNYIALKNQCLREGKLFQDPYFTPSNRSLYYTKQVPRGIRWLRPNQIISNPKFIENTANANDLDQGFIGNCWFIAGCAAVTFMPELFNKVVPKNQEFNTKDYAGIFHFRFWIYGFWHDVVIDDWLPVWEDGRLVFCSNKEEPNEFWAALLEKAYAKVCGSYENLEGGFTSDALIDMSGGLEESITIDKSILFKSQQSLNELWKILMKSRELKSMNAASIEPDPYIVEARLSNGLIKGHAYTITKVALIEINKRPIRLIRMRNPWGRIEWKGPWSDESREWLQMPEHVKKSLEFKRENEGEFWMDFENFYTYFDKIELCHLTPDAFSDEILKTKNSNTSLSWNMIAYHSEWEKNKSAGGSGNGNDRRYWQNPQFVVKLVDVDMNDDEDLATIIISLMQKYTREKRMRNNGEPAEEFLQFRFYRIVNDQDPERTIRNGVKFTEYQLEKVGNSGNYINKREITKRFRVKPGYYLIIPSLFDYNATGEFLLRIFTEKLIADDHTTVLHQDIPDEDFNNASIKPVPHPVPRPVPQPVPRPVPQTPAINPKPENDGIFRSEYTFNIIKPGIKKPTPSSEFFKNSNNLEDGFKDWMKVIGTNDPSSFFTSKTSNFYESAKKQFAEGVGSRLLTDNFENLSLNSLTDNFLPSHLSDALSKGINALNDNIKKVTYQNQNKYKKPQEACSIM